jgi:membrane protease YdiL (CAAX protease family)
MRVLAAAAVAITVSLALYFPKQDDGSGAVLGGIFAFAAVAIGLAAVRDVRPMPARSATERARLMGRSLALGAALGFGNLAANYAIALLDPTIHAQMTEQWARFSAWSAVFAGPMIEEIAYRLVIMGGTAWVVWRFTHDGRLVFATALTVSSVLFGVAHILPGSRPTTGVVHALGVAVKSSAGGVVLGWVFWRRGLPYSIACHGLANAVHLLAWPAIF